MLVVLLVVPSSSSSPTPSSSPSSLPFSSSLSSSPPDRTRPLVDTPVALRFYLVRQRSIYFFAFYVLLWVTLRVGETRGVRKNFIYLCVRFNYMPLTSTFHPGIAFAFVRIITRVRLWLCTWVYT